MPAHNAFSENKEEKIYVLLFWILQYCEIFKKSIKMLNLFKKYQIKLGEGNNMSGSIVHLMSDGGGGGAGNKIYKNLSLEAKSI